MVNWFEFFYWLNNDILAIPSTLLFFGVGIFFTFKTRFLQFRGFPRFISLITSGITRRKETDHPMHTIDSFHALFTAMSTTIGMGNVVGPSVAIMYGGPGALFWLILYMFLGSVIKYAEVVFALETREKTPDGYVIGGPMQYLKHISPWLGLWYTSVTIFLFIAFSGLQSNTLANVYQMEHIDKSVVGFLLALCVLLVLSGGAQRVGAVASKLVPVMFVLYITFSMFILCKDVHALYKAILLIFDSIVSPAAAMGGFMGATVFQAMQAGVYQSIFICEAGLGTSSIAHAVADTKRPTDQGILALYSIIADATLSMISGLLALVTGLWIKGEFRSTIAYEAFKLHSPTFGRLILLGAITLFVLTTVIGNSFNGTQSFGSLTRHRWISVYVMLTALAVFFGALIPSALAWQITTTLLTLVAVPNLIGIVILAIRNPSALNVSTK